MPITTLLIILIACLSISGWAIWHKNTPSYSTQTRETSNTPKVKVTPTKVKPAYAKYTNDEYGFSFEYPQKWVLEKDIKMAEDGYSQGTIELTSENNQTISFSLAPGGKGASCEPDESPAKAEPGLTGWGVV